MKTIVLYSSKTGFTANCATWIAEGLGADLSQIKDFDFSTLSAYDNIIYGGGLYAGGINGVKAFKKHLSEIHGKKTAVFFTGASRVKAIDIDEIVGHNFKPSENDGIEFFYFRGGFNFSKLSFLDKCLMGLMKQMIKSKKKKGELSADDKGMLNAFDRPMDFTAQEKIQPIINYFISKGSRPI